MPDLNFEIRAAEPLEHAAVPTMVFTLAITSQPAEEIIRNVLLTAQIQMETTRRQYSKSEQARLVDLFGEPSRWGQTLRPMLWTHASAVIPSFAASTLFELQVPCSFDFNIAATKYFDGLAQGEIALLFLFSGTVFYAGSEGALQTSRISWSKEARFRLPVAAWRGLMEAYYPNTAWLAVRKDIFDRLAEYKSRHGLASWEQALEKLLADSPVEPHKELAAR
jgi:Family of unknown function (DUF6084)